MNSKDFTVFPAIHLQDGQIIRFAQDKEGEDSSEVYSSDPVTCAKQWQERGADWLQIINLDAALEGNPRLNMPIIETICQLDIKVQYGGGIRDMQSVDLAMSAGVNRIIVGTAAVEDPQFMANVIETYGKDAIVLAIDTDEQGDVKTRGWRTTSDVEPTELGIKMRELGIQTAIHTHISQYGSMSGPSLTMSAELAEATGLNLIVSGGVGSQEDLMACYQHSGICGAVIGKAIHAGKIDLGEALKLVSQ